MFFNFFHTLYLQLDTIMVSKYLGDAAVGWYNAAYQPIVVLFSIAWVLMTALYPALSRYYRDNKEALARIFNDGLRLLVIIGLPIGAGIMLLAHRIVPVLFGATFAPSIMPFRILAWVPLFAFLNSGFTNFLNATDAPRKSFQMAAIGLGINFCANFYCIPKFGIAGAAMTTLFTEVVVCFFGVYWVSKTIPLSRLGKSIVRPVVATLVMSMVVWALRSAPLPFTIIIAALLYAAIAFAWQIITPADRAFVKTIFQKRNELAEPLEEEKGSF